MVGGTDTGVQRQPRQAARHRHLFPLPTSAADMCTLGGGQQTANNAPIQHVSALLLSRKEETWERSEKRSTNQCPESSCKGHSLSELLGSVEMFLQAGNEEAHVSLPCRLRNLLSHRREGAVCRTLTRKQEWWCSHWRSCSSSLQG